MWSAQAEAEGLTLLVADSKTGYFGVSLNHPGRPKPYEAHAVVARLVVGHEQRQLLRLRLLQRLLARQRRRHCRLLRRCTLPLRRRCSLWHRHTPLGCTRLRRWLGTARCTLWLEVRRLLHTLTVLSQHLQRRNHDSLVAGRLRRRDFGMRRHRGWGRTWLGLDRSIGSIGASRAPQIAGTS